MTLIFFVLIFGTIVLAHEFGHYLLAKVNGIHVVEFAIGMGPKLVGFHKNGTDYVIRLLPIGGACMFEGEDGLNEAEGEPSPNSFNAAPVWARISSVVAGPLFNFILAFLLAFILVGFSGSDKPVILGIMEGYPAEAAGMEPGDVITRMNGERIYLAREIYINTYLNGEKPMDVEYERNGEVFTTKLVPKYNEENGIIPQTVIKPVRDVIELRAKDEIDAASGRGKKAGKKKDAVPVSQAERDALITELTAEMKLAAKNLEFERAAYLRDRINEIKMASATSK